MKAAPIGGKGYTVALPRGRPFRDTAVNSPRHCAKRRYPSGYRLFIILDYSSQLPTVLGKGSTSRMLPMPVRYMTQRSKPRPKPA